MLNVIIACAGSQDKWNNYRGSPSHLVEDRFGEPILNRTVRMCNERGFRPTVVSPTDPRYIVDGARTTMLNRVFPTEYHSTRQEWADDRRNIVILGDTWFTEEAVDTILGDGNTHYRVYGRRDASRINGSPYGEQFAAAWHGSFNSVVEHLADRVAEAFYEGKLYRKTGWEVLQLFQGEDINNTRNGLMPHKTDPEYFTEINDYTNDIDFPQDYRRHPMFGGRR